MARKATRCKWAEGVSDAYIEYHDKEWGVPVYDDKTQFEFLILEGAQAGLSWSTILNKREGYRKAFVDFDGRPALGPIDLSIRAGEAVAVVGPSGSGKTTLLRLLNGTLPPTRGEVLVDLKEIRMEATADRLQKKAKKKRKDGEEEPPLFPPDTNWTDEAHRWLGLGRRMDDAKLQENSKALFKFTSLSDVSQMSAHLGGRKKKEDGGEIRKVYATGQGELSLRGFSVQRSLPVTVFFHYSDKASQRAVPESIEVVLRRDFRVPLSEYDIEPRDDSGRTITGRWKALGRLVSDTARITGSLHFELEK